MEKISQEQYNDLVAKIATDILAGEFEKEAGLKEYVVGDRDFSKDTKTHFWKDRVGGTSVTSLPAAAVSDVTTQAVGKITGNPLLAMGTGYGVGSAAIATATHARGKNLAKKNEVEWKNSDTAKSLLIPFQSPDSIVKKKMRQKEKATQEDIINKAAELYIDALMQKQAAYEIVEESEIIAQAAEVALNKLGYTMEE